MVTQGFCDSLLRKATQDGIRKHVVGGVIQDSHGRALILRRAAKEKFLPGLEELPSGGVDPGESLLQGLTREIREETGLQVKSVVRYIDSFDYASSSGKQTRQWNFVVDASGHQRVKLNPEEHESFRWVGPEDAAQSQCSEQTRRSLDHFWHVKAPVLTNQTIDEAGSLGES